MTDILAPSSTISIAVQSVDVLQSCILAPETTTPGSDDIWVPVAPGITYGSLPGPPVVVDTSPDQIIGCIQKTDGNAQERLNNLFPDAIAGDGVLEKFNGDYWVFDGALWNNVGPNPGPKITYESVIPVWNEVVKCVAKTSTGLSARLLPYAINLLTEVAPTTKTKVTAKSVLPIEIGTTLDIAISVDTPEIFGGATRIASAIEKLTGTAAPLLGDTQVVISTATADGWLLIFNNTADEGATQTGDFGFDFILDGETYRNCYVNSNAYITFGGTVNEYSSLDQDTPAFPKIHIGSGDFSYQRVYTKKQLNTFRIRLEGNSMYNALAGNSNRFVEIGIYSKPVTNEQFVEIRSGDVAGSLSGPFMLANATTAFDSGSYAANESWVYTGNDDGTSWTLAQGEYISYSEFVAPSMPSPAGIEITRQVPSVET